MKNDETSEHLEKMVFPLPEGEIASAETMWVQRFGGDAFQLDSIPAVAYDLALGDVVRGKYTHGRLTFDSVIRRSGNTTVRIAKSDSTTDIAFDVAVQLILAFINSVNGKCERNDGYIAMSLPSISVDDLEPQLISGRDNGLWSYEVSHE